MAPRLAWLRKTVQKIGVLGVMACLLTAAALGAPAVSLSLGAGPPTSNLMVSGSGFPESSVIDLYFDTTVMVSVTSSTSGGFSQNLQVPAAAQPGTHQVTAVVQFSDIKIHAAVLVQTNWVEFGFTCENQRNNPYEDVLNPSNVGYLALDWSFTTSDEVQSSPAVVNGVVYVGSDDYNLYALNASTGAQLWSFKTGFQVLSSPAVANGVVYVGSRDGKVYALNATTGAQLWSFATGSDVESSPAVSNGVVYVGSRDHNVYALNATTGAKLWSFATGLGVDSSPAVANGVVYVGSNDSNVYALNATTGAQLWSFKTGFQVLSSPAVANGVVYVGSGEIVEPGVYALNATTGAKLWSFATRGEVTSSPAVANGVVYVGSWDWNVYALNATTGAQLWSFTTGDQVRSSPAVANGVVYVGSDDHNVYALNATTGAQLWSFATGNLITSSPAVANGVVYVGSWDGKLYGFDQPRGQLVRLSTDTFSNTYSEHRSEVEPDTTAWGATIVAAFQVARVHDGGGADIGFATSKDGGITWSSGYLPGLTINYLGGSFSAASDPAVAYDARHGVWLISSLPIQNNLAEAVATSRSSDGINWSKPVIVDESGSDDKNWITCDNTPTSRFYGHCYTEWDEPGLRDLIFMSTSTDGGLTWGPAKMTADYANGIGGQPLVQPNGNVVVPIDIFGAMGVFTSSDGGNTWSRTFLIANQNFRRQDGGLRSPGLPSAAIDHAGRIYVVWPDCSFRSGCSTDDIVLSTSLDGTTWTNPVRVPIDPLTSTVDHFIVGLGIDPATSGNTAQLTMTYYYYPKASCGNSCQLFVGFTTSQNGGQTWTAGKRLAGPMSLTWLAPSQNGQMVADYLSVAYSNGNPFGVFAVASAPTNSLLNEAMYTTASPLLAALNEARISSTGERPLPDVKGTYVWRYYDDEGKYPILPSRQGPPPQK